MRGQGFGAPLLICTPEKLVEHVLAGKGAHPHPEEVVTCTRTLVAQLLKSDATSKFLR